MTNKKAVLLINLGTPNHCDATSIRQFLREFLEDPRVIDLPAIIRKPLVNLFIIPFRYKRIVKAYQQIWTSAGSPLLANSKKMQIALAKELGEEYVVELGMRYGEPSIESVLEKIKQYESIVVIPLFPQYASASTGSSLEEVFSYFSKQWNMQTVSIKSNFYNAPGFIHAYADVIKHHLHNKEIDKLIFSYHGLPLRHILKSACTADCNRVNACPSISANNCFCYRAECYATTQLIAHKLGLSSNQYTVAFQSRLGKTPWIKPYTDLVLPELIQRGIKNIAIVSPSFVADCLETLEEINIRTRQQWMTLGGKDFTFIPCINDSELWIKALAEFAR